MTERATVSRWLGEYEAAWRAPGTGRLAVLFTSDATYLQSPYEQPVTGLAAIGRMWEDEREGPGEVFTLATQIIAVDGPTAVVRAEVSYAGPPGQEYRDLWVLQLDDAGRCRWFEEWPFWPENPYATSPGRPCRSPRSCSLPASRPRASPRSPNCSPRASRAACTCAATSFAR